MSEKITKPVPLETPIVRGESTIKEITLRKPQGGELRGVSLVNLLNMDYASLEIVLPRISTPPLTVADVRTIDPADLVQLATEITGFLLTKQAKEGFQTA